MVQWWEGLDVLSRILYCITIPASLILVLQTLLIILGFGDAGEGVNPSDTSGLDLDVDVDMDYDMDVGTDIGDGTGEGDYEVLRLFTLQGIIAFFAVFGWTSIITYHAGLYPVIAIPLGLVAGFFTMYAVARFVSFSRKLTSSGNISLKNALGATARVYLPIEPGGQGKVTVMVQERLIEADAVTESEKVLPSGSMVRVIDVRAGLLVVEEE